MTLVIDKKGVLWQIDQWGHYVIHSDPAPIDATVIRGNFDDGFTATKEDFESAFGTRNYNMRVAAQSTTYELTVTELKALMAKELGVLENSITIRFKTREVGDERFGPTSQETYAVEVVVDGPQGQPAQFDNQWPPGSK